MKSKVLALILLCGAASLGAKVKLPALVGDNMILQQQTEVKLWGTAAPEAEVRVTPSWNGQTMTCRADKDGGWTLAVETPAAGYTPYEITFDDGEKTTLKNILIGEVWLASGQSNMEMPLKGFAGCCIMNGADDIIVSAENKGVRMFTVPKHQTYELQTDCKGSWNISSIETMLRPMLMYNAMLKPLQNYTIKGFIWYQGESNVGRHETYAERLADMVQLWRKEWGLGELPFYFAEIAPYAYGGTQQEKAAYLREAQFRAQSLIPNSGMISTNDLVEPYEMYNIHPRNKTKVGQRLSYLALNLTYGLKQIHCFGPQYKSWTAKGSEAWVSFDHLEMGICRNYDLRGFEVAGEDRVFHPADKVWLHWQTNEVVISSEKVSHPVSVRYCFHDFQIGTMIGGNELPTIPFRTDNW